MCLRVCDLYSIVLQAGFPSTVQSMYAGGVPPLTHFVK